MGTSSKVSDPIQEGEAAIFFNLFVPNSKDTFYPRGTVRTIILQRIRRNFRTPTEVIFKKGKIFNPTVEMLTS